MGKKGRRGADDWEKDFELDDEGNLAALKEEQPAEAAAPAAGKLAALRPMLPRACRRSWIVETC